jgi:hypothetical protein
MWHTKDNADGLIANIVAWSATGIVAGIMYKEIGEGGMEATHRLLTSMFNHSLQHTIQMMDCGYWFWSHIASVLNSRS